MLVRPRTTPRKKPRQERSIATRDALLEATARVLKKHGFDRASTNRIATEAGVSIGSLYQYFPSKESLVAALVERHVDEMSALLESALARVATAPLPVAVRELVRLMLAAHAVDPKLHKVLVEQTPRTGRLDRLQDVERRATALAIAYLEAHRDELRPENLELAAFVTVRTVEALTHAAVIEHPEGFDVEALENEITALITRYLVAEAEQ